MRHVPDRWIDMQLIETQQIVVQKLHNQVNVKIFQKVDSLAELIRFKSQSSNDFDNLSIKTTPIYRIVTALAGIA